MRFTVLTLLFLLSGAVASPVPKAATTVPDISGTIWKGTDKWSHGMNQEVTLTFEPGGKLIYHQDKAVPAKWSQDGSTIRFEINNYSRYEAKLDNRTLTGGGGNNDNQTCTFTFTRQGP